MIKEWIHLTNAVGNIVKNTVVYSYALSQPFAFYIDAYPMIQNENLSEAQTISYGQSGENVHYLQVKLNHLGYYEDDLDGEYGILTEQAVKKMQSGLNLDPDGIANDETIQVLMKTEKETQLRVIEDLMDDLHYGAKSDAIREIQEILYLYGYYDSEIDSIYGPITESAYYTLKEEIDGPIEQTEIPQPIQDVEVRKETTEDESLGEIEQDKPKQVETHNNGNVNIIEEARSLTGIPYLWGGTSTAGFDCSGFIQYVYKEQNITIPRTVTDIWNFASPTDSASVGDLVFFETYKAGPSHLGIYIGNDEFIHAGVSNGVQISSLNSDYWQQRYIGSKRIQ